MENLIKRKAPSLKFTGKYTLKFHLEVFGPEELAHLMA